MCVCSTSSAVFVRVEFLMCVFLGLQVCFVSISQFVNDFWFLLFSCLPHRKLLSVWTDVLSRDETTAAHLDRCCWENTSGWPNLQSGALEAPEGNTGSGSGLFIC